MFQWAASKTGREWIAKALRQGGQTSDLSFKIARSQLVSYFIFRTSVDVAAKSPSSSYPITFNPGCAPATPHSHLIRTKYYTCRAQPGQSGPASRLFASSSPPQIAPPISFLSRRRPYPRRASFTLLPHSRRQTWAVPFDPLPVTFRQGGSGTTRGVRFEKASHAPPPRPHSVAPFVAAKHIANGRVLVLRQDALILIQQSTIPQDAPIASARVPGRLSGNL